MNIYIMSDMEGISGIVATTQTSTLEGRYYETGRRYMTWDINACVDGCFRGGADKVLVADVHGSGRNVIWEDLDPRADYIVGPKSCRMPEIDRHDGLILLGYHARAATREAILEHTMSSASWQHFWMNGKEVGELGIDAGIAGDHGVPVIMVSGDDKTCREARGFLRGVVAVEVKKGLACEGGILIPKDRAHALIRSGAARAVQACKTIKPYKVKSPVTMRVELVSRRIIPEKRRPVKIIDGRTYEVTGKTVEGTYDLL